MILSLAIAYIRTINNGKTPVIHSAITYVINSQIENATKLALHELDGLFKDGNNEIKTAGANWKQEFKKRSMKLFSGKVIGDDKVVKEASDK